MGIHAKAKRQRDYLTAYVNSDGDKTGAARDTAIPLRTVQRWFKEDEDFQAQLEAVSSTLERTLLEEAVRRGLEKSDILLMFTLKSLNPARYDDAVRKAKALNIGSELIDSSVSSRRLSGKDIFLMLQEADPFIDYASLAPQRLE